MGLSSRTQKTTSSEKASATTKPIVPGFIQQPTQDYFSQVSQFGQTGRPQTFGPTANQTTAFQGAGQLGANNGDQSAALGTIRGFAATNPIADADYSKYMDPYQRNVVNATLADWEQGVGRGINWLKTGDASTYGGTRDAVAQGEFLSGQSRNLGATLADLYSSGFRNAQDRAYQDAGFRLGAAGQLLSGAQSADANTRANLGTQYELGDAERQLAQSNDPYTKELMRLAAQQGLLGVNPSDLFGNQVDSTGSSTSKTKSSGSTLDAIGQIISILNSGMKLGK